MPFSSAELKGALAEWRKALAKVQEDYAAAAPILTQWPRNVETRATQMKKELRGWGKSMEIQSI